MDKLVIRAFNALDYSGECVDEFSTFVNSNELEMAFENEYFNSSDNGILNGRMSFYQVNSRDLSLSFELDGISLGNSGGSRSVHEQVEQFQKVVGYKGDFVENRYLKILWGTLQMKRCIVKKFSVSYKMFSSDGLPLRAVLSATFADHSTLPKRFIPEQDYQADLIHVRTVKAGNSLPAMCREIYGDPDYFPHIAKANRIEDFRRLRPGTRIFFPPIVK